MVKVLIIGSTGLLGTAVLEYFRKSDKYEVKHVARSLGDAPDLLYDIIFNDVKALTEYVKWSDYVINCAGITNKKDIPTKDVIKINSIFPLELSSLCVEHDAKMIHISTDCVFSGRYGEYSETSDCDALTVYGMTKHLGEPENCMVIRTSIIGDKEGDTASFVGWLKSNAGGTVDGYTNHFWNGVTTKTYANICDQIISKGLFETGLFHVFSEDCVSKFVLAQMVNDRFNLSITILKHVADSGVDRSLSTSKYLCSDLDIPPLAQQIRNM